MKRQNPGTPDQIEWPTLALVGLCYAGWLASVFLLPGLGLWLAIPVTAVLITLHASLTHEILHGHPFRNQRLNEALVMLPLNLAIPYARFRDQHLEHHRDADLTDPYDDPESNYADPEVWAAMPAWKQALLRANNTLLGRIVLGPVLAQVAFMAGEWRAIRAGDRALVRVWWMHPVWAGAVLAVVAVSPMPVWAYLLAAYGGLAILRIRTFAEHRAHERTRARTVIIEDRGPLAFLFLNNNFHVVHHMHPRAPWYTLPDLYRRKAAHYRASNDNYVFRNYAEVFSRYLLRAKDPVAHPLWSRD
ncbi:MAG: fatty acid desaturase [Marinibacterium sp.]